MRRKESVLIVFAKKPVSGKVKTRLCPPLSSIQAKQVATLLIKKTIENISAHWPGKFELCIWPDTRDDGLVQLTSDYDIELMTQVSGDLGEKMCVAMTQKVNMGHNVMIMGADVPHCSGEIFHTAYQALKADKNVIGPTIDGGYYCIGVHNPATKMFENVSWGSEMAYAQTISSCARAGISFDVILPRLNDLDSFDDLVQISEQLPELREFIDEKND